MCDCGVRYCSPECMGFDLVPHGLLCTAKVDSEAHPLVAFKVHAIQTNDMFLTGARMVALALSDDASAKKFENIQHAPWHDAVPCPADEPDPVQFAQDLKELAEETRHLLEKAILLPQSEHERVKTACGRFSDYLGCLELNQFEICIDPDDEPCGAGVFSMCCSANHDCSPNAEVVFTSKTNQATLRALRDIQPNEEICISYVETELTLDERRAELRDYGFVCACNRCQTEERWSLQQVELAKRVISDRCDEDFSCTRLGGFDISFPEDDRDPSVACFVVLSFPDLKVLYEKCQDVRLTEPYIPGFLAFREAPVCEEMLRDVPSNLRPDVLILDGSGILHPRECGLASHIGVVCNIPTIGVSKKILAVDGLTREKIKKLVKKHVEKGKREIDLVGDSGRLRGRALVSPGAQNAVFVSVGHRLNLATATDIVRKACEKTRVPAPIRHADLTSREELRKRQKQGSSSSSS